MYLYLICYSNSADSLGFQFWHHPHVKFIVHFLCTDFELKIAKKRPEFVQVNIADITLMSQKRHELKFDDVNAE